MRRALLVALGIYAAVALWHQVKPMPPGTDLAGSWHPAAPGEVSFLTDLTYRQDGDTRREQEIFDRLLALIAEARSFVVLDQFLFNDFAGDAGQGRPLSEELTAALERKKAAVPELRVLFITDPINVVYGGERSPHLERLEGAGVEVVLTDLARLRDSNVLYSPFWRLVPQWLGNSTAGGRFANPFRDDSTSLRSLLALLNFKANHRKVAIVDLPSGDLAAMVASSNPHDASSGHSNVALLFGGRAARELLESELAVARFSGWSGVLPEVGDREVEVADGGGLAVRVVTEQAICESLVAALRDLGPGDTVDLAMFYLAERRTVAALLLAAERGAAVRVLLDPNRDAFGRQKDGVPNRPVAHELVRRSGGRIEVRWYRTEGEQFHTKLVALRRAEDLVVSLGSANLTRRNVGNYNLEANVEVRSKRHSPFDQELTSYFDRLWLNADGASYSEEFERFADPSRLRYWRYRLMEATGLSTF